jgi:hypothetical protein
MGIFQELHPFEVEHYEEEKMMNMKPTTIHRCSRRRNNSNTRHGDDEKRPAVGMMTLELHSIPVHRH